MHHAAMEWVERYANAEAPQRVLDVGGRDVNGNPRHLFHPDSTWECVDLHDGPGVTVVSDFMLWDSVENFDTILHLEVAEHAIEWPSHVNHAASMLKTGGVFIFTAAGLARQAHSAIDGAGLRPGEHYRNVDPERLVDVLDHVFGSSVVDVATNGEDVRAAAWL